MRTHTHILYTLSPSTTHPYSHTHSHSPPYSHTLAHTLHYITTGTLMRAWKSTSSSDSCWGSPSSTASSLISKCPWYGNPLLSFCCAMLLLCFCYSSFTPHLFLIPLSFHFPFLFLLLGFLSTFIIYLSVFFLLFVGFVHIYRHPSLPPFLHLIPCYFSSLLSFKFSLHLPSSKYPFFPPPLLLSSATPFKSFIPYTYTHLTHSIHTHRLHTHTYTQY